MYSEQPHRVLASALGPGLLSSLLLSPLYRPLLPNIIAILEYYWVNFKSKHIRVFSDISRLFKKSFFTVERLSSIIILSRFFECHRLTPELDMSFKKVTRPKSLYHIELH